MFVAQVLVNGTVIGSSGSSPKVWWWISGICFAISLLYLMDPESSGEVGMISCCSSLFTGIIALSYGSKKTTVLVQQMPQMYTQPVIQQVIQQPVQQRQTIQQQPQGQMSVQQQRQTNQGNQQNLAQQAKNLEMARDFKGAADMYQKAGLFAEAGRVRQSHLEKDDKPVVQIGQVGNSVVKDSVVMGSTNQSINCPNCGSEIQADWKFCPACNSPL